jgi:hypothetical protein
MVLKRVLVCIYSTKPKRSREENVRITITVRLKENSDVTRVVWFSGIEKEICEYRRNVEMRGGRGICEQWG